MLAGLIASAYLDDAVGKEIALVESLVIASIAAKETSIVDYLQEVLAEVVDKGSVGAERDFERGERPLSDRFARKS